MYGGPLLKTPSKYGKGGNTCSTRTVTAESASTSHTIPEALVNSAAPFRQDIPQWYSTRARSTRSLLNAPVVTAVAWYNSSGVSATIARQRPGLASPIVCQAVPKGDNALITESSRENRGCRRQDGEYARSRHQFCTRIWPAATCDGQLVYKPSRYQPRTVLPRSARIPDRPTHPGVALVMGRLGKHHDGRR